MLLCWKAMAGRGWPAGAENKRGLEMRSVVGGSWIILEHSGMPAGIPTTNPLKMKSRSCRWFGAMLRLTCSSGTSLASTEHSRW